MFSQKLISLALVVLMLLALVVLAPARLVVSLVPDTALIMHGVTGSAWRGEASRAVLQTGDGYFHLGAVSWRVKPLSLLLFAPQLDVTSHWGGQRIKGSVRLQGADHFALEDVDAVLDAKLLRHYAPLELFGSVSLQSSRLVIRDGLPIEGVGRVVWLEGGWVSTQGQRALGSYAIDFTQQQKDVLKAEVITLDGGLQAAGELRLEGRNYEINVFLSGPAISDPQLQRALQLVAAPQGDGFQVKLSGAL